MIFNETLNQNQNKPKSSYLHASDSTTIRHGFPVQRGDRVLGWKELAGIGFKADTTGSGDWS